MKSNVFSRICGHHNCMCFFGIITMWLSIPPRHGRQHTVRKLSEPSASHLGSPEWPTNRKYTNTCTILAWNVLFLCKCAVGWYIYISLQQKVIVISLKQDQRSFLIVQMKGLIKEKKAFICMKICTLVTSCTHVKGRRLGLRFLKLRRNSVTSELPFNAKVSCGQITTQNK